MMAKWPPRFDESNKCRLKIFRRHLRFIGRRSDSRIRHLFAEQGLQGCGKCRIQAGRLGCKPNKSISRLKRWVYQPNLRGDRKNVGYKYPTYIFWCLMMAKWPPRLDESNKCRLKIFRRPLRFIVRRSDSRIRRLFAEQGFQDCGKCRIRVSDLHFIGRLKPFRRPCFSVCRRVLRGQPGV